MLGLIRDFFYWLCFDVICHKKEDGLNKLVNFCETSYQQTLVKLDKREKEEEKIRELRRKVDLEYEKYKIWEFYQSFAHKIPKQNPNLKPK